MLDEVGIYFISLGRMFSVRGRGRRGHQGKWRDGGSGHIYTKTSFSKKLSFTSIRINTLSSAILTMPNLRAAV